MQVLAASLDLTGYQPRFLRTKLDWCGKLPMDDDQNVSVRLRWLERKDPHTTQKS